MEGRVSPCGAHPEAGPDTDDRGSGGDGHGGSGGSTPNTGKDPAPQPQPVSKVCIMNIFPFSSIVKLTALYPFPVL